MLDTAENLIPDNSPAVLNGMPASAVRGELDRILRSRVFVHSHRIRRFLQFVVEECLAGRQHRLKEYLIGMEVFNRLEAFDPRVDSIVRVEARRLRAKLEGYYLTEGREDELRIELRKGSYVPLFEYWRSGSNGYSYGVAPLRRSSVAIGKLATHNGETPQLVSDITHRLTQVLIQEGCRVVAPVDGADSVRPDYVIQGSIEQHREDVKVRLQLMSLPDGSYLWSEEGLADDIETLARSMNRTVVTSHGKNGQQRLQRRSHGQSFDLYLKGRYQWKTFTPDTVRSSILLFQKAVERDPAYAAAWAALAGASIVSSLFGFASTGETAAQIKDATRRAMELNEALPEAHVALGTTLSIVDGNWTAGEREFQRAIQLEGRDAGVHVAYGLQLACRGMPRHANAELERALELDPASLSTNFALGWLQCITQHYDESIAQHRLVSQLAPDFPLAYLGLGWSHLGKGEFADAIAYFSNAKNLLKCHRLLQGCIGHCYARMGNREDAVRQMELLNTPQGGGQPAWISMAAISVGMQDVDQAFTYLDGALDNAYLGLPLRLLGPEFDLLRDQPRYLDLCARMGLAIGAPALAVASAKDQAAPVH